jgi:hypothetical protein
MNFIDEVGLDKNNVRYSGASKFYEEILTISLDNINNNTPALDFKTTLAQLTPHIKSDSHIAKLKKIITQQHALLKRFGFATLYKATNKQSLSNAKLISTRGKGKTHKRK